MLRLILFHSEWIIIFISIGLIDPSESIVCVCVVLLLGHYSHVWIKFLHSQEMLNIAKPSVKPRYLTYCVFCNTYTWFCGFIEVTTVMTICLVCVPSEALSNVLLQACHLSDLLSTVYAELSPPRAYLAVFLNHFRSVLTISFCVYVFQDTRNTSHSKTRMLMWQRLRCRSTLASLHTMAGKKLIFFQTGRRMTVMVTAVSLHVPQFDLLHDTKTE
jgi:hypothetical protein